MKPMTLNVIADGGIKGGNPGGFGYGSFAVAETFLEQREYGHSNDGHPMTNIVAEILTCIASLRWTALHVPEAKRYSIAMTNDCQWVVKHLSSPNSRSSKPHLKRLHHEWLLVKSLFADVRLSWHGRERSVAILGH